MSPATLLRPLKEEEWTRYRVSEENACFGSLRTAQGHLPLRDMRIQGRITGLAYRLRLVQSFVNTYSTSLEATYIFPLPARAAVSHFVMRTRDRETHGELRERGQARQIYAQAVAQGFQAALAEQERPEVFTMTVGNIPPGESIEIELELSGPLAVSDGMATFRFPLVVAPRYMPGRGLAGGNVGDGTAYDTDATPDASRISPPVLLHGYPNPVRLGLEIELDGAGLDYSEIYSSIEQVYMARSASGLDALALAPIKGELNRDLILRFPIVSQSIRSSLSSYTNPEEGTATWALTLLPSGAMNTTMPPRNLVVLLDRSGSMQGWKMAAARRAVGRIVDCFTDHDRFAVLAFDNVVEDVLPGVAPTGSGHRVGGSSLRQASDSQRFAAVQALAKVEARGGTELGVALMEGIRRLDQMGGNEEKFIVLVTDGQVGNEDQLVREVERRGKAIRIFTVGIDEAVNGGLLERFATVSGGHCELVESEARLDEVMRFMQQRMGHPLLTNIRLHLPGSFDVTPDGVDLYPGLPARLYGRCQDGVAMPTAVTVEGRDREGHLWRQDIPVHASPDSVIETLWARERLLELEHGFVTQKRGAEFSAAGITQFSLAHNVLCRFTSFVAVDRTRRVQHGAPGRSVVQSVDAPAGWQNPAGAPPAGAARTVAASPQKQVLSRAQAPDPFARGGDPFAAPEAFAEGGIDPFAPSHDAFCAAPVACADPFSVGGGDPFASAAPDPFARPAVDPFGPGAGSADPFASAPAIELSRKCSVPAPAPRSAPRPAAAPPPPPCAEPMPPMSPPSPVQSGFAPPASMSPPPPVKGSSLAPLSGLRSRIMGALPGAAKKEKGASSPSESIRQMLDSLKSMLEAPSLSSDATQLLERLVEALSKTQLKLDLVKKGYKVLEALRTKHPGAHARLAAWHGEVTLEINGPEASREGWWKI